MSRRLFGTDGVRGRVNDHPMTVEVALSLGKAVGHFFNPPTGDGLVVIGRDTRSSGSMIEAALVSGLASVGCAAGLMGVAPTPAVAHLAASSTACAGLVISASHNPYWDNGIKVFKGDGFKLSDDEESQLEALCLDHSPPVASPEACGYPRPIEPPDGYLGFLRRTAAKCDLGGLRIALDCASNFANGASQTHSRQQKQRRQQGTFAATTRCPQSWGPVLLQMVKTTCTPSRP